jgi:hypothetical protein
MSDTFRAAIHDAVFRGMSADEHRWEQENAVVTTVLAMPEMQAIRQALQQVAEEDRYAFGGLTLPAEALADRDLPESVIAWVVGHDRP